MDDKIIELICSQGLWAFLSIILIFYVLKNQQERDLKQEEREFNYQKIIHDLSNELNIVNDINKDIKLIKNSIETCK